MLSQTQSHTLGLKDVTFFTSPFIVPNSVSALFTQITYAIKGEKLAYLSISGSQCKAIWRQVHTLNVIKFMR
ncbi:hypothetical protein OFN53_31720, partial [Escherichia coli]|nr:hypothetical protein [Escherichia coli]